MLAGKAVQMSMKLEIHPEPGFLTVRAVGEFSLEEARRTFLEMLEAVARHNVRKVLFDGRGLVGEPRTMERLYYGKFTAQAVVAAAARLTQFAYVLEVPVLDPWRFGENVAVNRGMFVKAFDNQEDALEWLSVSPTNESDAGDDK